MDLALSDNSGPTPQPTNVSISVSVSDSEHGVYSSLSLSGEFADETALLTALDRVRHFVIG